MIGYKTLAKGEINLNYVIQYTQNLDLNLYLNTNEKSKHHQDDLSILVGYVSIICLSSIIPNQSESLIRPDIGLTSNPLSIDDEYIEEEELNSELEDSDIEFNSKIKQKFNKNLIRNKLIQMFKRKNVQPIKNSITTIKTHTTNLDRQSDIEEEDPPSDISDSTIPVDQWSIESVPKPGFTPVEHLQILNFV
jgi:hypothetical protein